MASGLKGPPLPVVERSISKPVSLFELSVQPSRTTIAESAVAPRPLGRRGTTGGAASKGAAAHRPQLLPVTVPFTVVPAEPYTVVPVPSLSAQRPTRPVSAPVSCVFAVAAIALAERA